LPPVETSGQGSSPRRSPRLPAALFRVLKACRLGILNQLFQTTLHSWRIAESFSWMPQPRLSRRKRQSIDPPQHTGKQPPRHQMTLRQQQPIIPCMFHQPAARLHQPLLETRQRPVADPVRQCQGVGFSAWRRSLRSATRQVWGDALGRRRTARPRFAPGVSQHYSERRLLPDCKSS
jgi:hypothetical protein